ncbi:uncharacterized protein BDR25DRAFT_349035 [Lindgomyces ingoldianus]|uniref:Uncharacterized protein n=1 Tax=Lindgomyces ingoldianus TaxID=673940 RepID=A0ACB6RF93_9PLEO|nr:uncharacterized protein BDR25DRAFT_349035 [Lindgomyces ingoldianus]KAF2477141.1 hypothetical protein BDR25DRAFT_349035 [Lindgomyces ingoldianus]
MRVHGWYIIHLRPGHTMEKHSEAVGVDMETYSHGVLDTVYPNNVAYLGRDIDKDLLKRVREDPGVESVTCDARLPQEVSRFLKSGVKTSYTSGNIVLLFGTLVKLTWTTPAPFYGDSHHHNALIRDSYTVKLGKGHTLHDHWHNIGVSEPDFRLSSKS